MTEPYDPNYSRGSRPRRRHAEVIKEWLPGAKAERNVLSRKLYDVAIQIFIEKLASLTFAEKEVVRDMIDILSSDDADAQERYAAAATLMEALS